MLEMNLPSILAKVKNERELQKVYSNEMAAYLEISEKTYQRIERLESDLSLNHFLQICQKLNRRPEYFLGSENAVFFQDCQYSGYHNTNNMNEPSNEMIQLAKALTKLVQNHTENSNTI